MENENQDVDLNNETALETVETPEAEPAERVEKVFKKEFTDEQQLAIHEREAKKLKKRLGVETNSKQTRSDELDYGQLAFLTAKGIENDEEVDYVKKVMSETGKPLKDVLGSKYFQAELKEMRDGRISAEAIPKGTKRSSGSAVDNVDYWIAKDELPPDTPENRKLREDIVKEQYRREKNVNTFGSPGKLIIK
jgi:hypothetical protein